MMMMQCADDVALQRHYYCTNQPVRCIDRSSRGPWTILRSGLRRPIRAQFKQFNREDTRGERPTTLALFLWLEDKAIVSKGNGNKMTVASEKEYTNICYECLLFSWQHDNF